MRGQLTKMLPHRKHFLFILVLMPAERLPLNHFLELSHNHVVLDVRSPGEYNHAHIPGAINLPLFTDEERKIVGTTYKQQSREHAIKVGLDFFGPKMRRMVEEIESICNRQQGMSNGQNAIGNGQFAISNNQQHATGSGHNCQLPVANFLLIYCWRGGMRSAAVAWLMDLYGYKVYTLRGGYKSFRNHVLKTFEQDYDINILGGFTGSGKTEVLNELKRNGETIIDLEKLACHKGSAFGKTDKPQPSQEMFENLVSVELERARSKKQIASGEEPAFTLWLEDESQRIGNLNIPNALWRVMRKSPIYFLDIPFEERLKHIVEEYGNTDKEQLAECIVRISKRLGPLETKTSLQFLEEGKVEECFSILLQYYDKKYQKGLYSREHLSSMLRTIECKEVTTANAEMVQAFSLTLHHG